MQKSLSGLLHKNVKIEYCTPQNVHSGGEADLDSRAYLYSESNVLHPLASKLSTLPSLANSRISAETMEKLRSIASLLDSMNISNLQKRDDFHVLKFKDHIDQIPRKTEARKCDFFLVYFSDQYEVDVIVDDTPFSAKSRTLISFLSPLQTLSVDVKDVDTHSNGYMLAFQSSFFRKGWSGLDLQRRFPFFNANQSPVFFLNEGQRVFAKLVEKIYTLFQDLSPDNTEILRSYLNILFFEARKAFLQGAIDTAYTTRAQQIAFSFENLVKVHSRERRSLAFYAERLHISPVYLSECVKKSTDKGPKQILNEYTFLDASTLLLQSQESISRIAEELGFSAASNFVNFFKKRTGLTPLGYRKRYAT